MIIDAPEVRRSRRRRRGSAATASPLRSRNSALYFPRLREPDPLMKGIVRSFPAAGALAGLYARTDAERGVWKAPAGTTATIVGATGLSYTLTDGENGTLNPLGLNCLRTFPVFGTVALGRPHGQRRGRDGRRVQVHPGPPPRAVPRGEPVSRHAVGGVRAERRAAVGADPAQPRRLHAHPLRPGRVPGHARRAMPTS